ncbi:hypothetical protein Dda_2076 [Drechslerella dactyloides]|uniref:Mannose-1-phosphate guanyltransferase n=1 Tax=Drechslerella dactyloides TaxID=74499 RepID=A0AAD6NMB0_DREDA|nr:hypothetical protein Dda_2076 [Drechslerella dactyloides]
MPSTHHALGLTAVILCGEGNELKPILSSPKFCKALLPVAGKPMIQYPLEWLLDARLDSIVIVCIQGQEGPIRTAVKTIYENRAAYAPKNAKHVPLPEVVGVATPGKAVGTAEVFRQPQVYSLIKNDFMVVACDAFCEVPAATVIKEWMLLPETLGERTGALGVWYDIKKEKKTERDVVLTAAIPRFEVDRGYRTFEACTDRTTNMSYLLEHFGTFHDHPTRDVAFRKAAIARHPKVVCQTGYRDCHIYIFPYWTLKFIRANYKNKMNSIKDDIVPLIAKAGWQNHGILAQKIGLHQIVTARDDENEDTRSVSLGSIDSVPPGGLTETDIENFLGFSSMRKSTWKALPEAMKDRKEINTRGWFPTPTKNKEPSPTLSPTGSDDAQVFKKIKLPLFNGLFVPGIALFKPKMNITPLATTPLIRRVDSLALYLATCLELARNPLANEQPISSTAIIHMRANVSSIDSKVGEGSKVDEKVLVKRSVIGKNVHLSKMTKIQGSVVLDGTSIGAGTKLEGCVIGRFVKLGAGIQLTNCQVAEGVELRDGTIEKDKLVTESSQESSDEEGFFEDSEDHGAEDDQYDEDDADKDAGDQDSDEEENSEGGHENDDDDDDDDDGDTDDDDGKTTKSVPTTTRESVAPISSVLSTTPVTTSKETLSIRTSESNDTVPTADTSQTSEPKQSTLLTPEPSGSDEVKEQTKETDQSAEQEPDVEGSEEEEETGENGPAVPFLQLELQEEEEDQDQEGDFEPDSDESSFCDEEYDSQFESDGMVSGDDTGNLSGPEEDGGPLKSPKRISKSFSEEMKKNLAQVIGLELGESSKATEETLSKPTEEKDTTQGEGLLESTEAGDKSKDESLPKSVEGGTTVMNNDSQKPIGTGDLNKTADIPRQVEVEGVTLENSLPKPAGVDSATSNANITPASQVVDPVGKEAQGK